MTPASGRDRWDQMETALERVGTCLQACGVVADTRTCVEILGLIQEGLQSHPDDLLEWLIDETRRRFLPPPAALPSPCPPLARGSIGYGEPT